jgi:nucleoside-diphosphate-sugar epimerase
VQVYPLVALCCAIKLMARILVTGASGFIGSHVTTHLASLGHHVVATGRSQALLDCLCSTAKDKLLADLAIDRLEPLLESCDAVVHCAALSSPWGTKENFWNANVIATERLLEASQRAGVRRFVHLGSPSIYFRFADQLNVDESFQPPKKWITEYARSKWASELRVQAAAAKGIETLVLRPRAVFGEGDRAILPRLLAIADKGWFPLMHQGKAVIDVTYVANVVQAVVACLDADVRCDGRAYNITNAEPISLHQLVTRLFAALGKNVRLIPVPRNLALIMASMVERIAMLREGKPEPRLTRYGVGVIGYSQTLDISRAQRELSYFPKTSIDDGLTQFARWWINGNS